MMIYFKYNDDIMLDDEVECCVLARKNSLLEH